MALLLGFGFWLLPPSSPPEPPSSPTRVESGRPAALVHHLATPETRTLPAPSGDANNLYARKPETNQVEFRVVDGLAIAYGDVLLGKPEAGFAGDRGVSETPTPQLWENPEIPYAINPDLPNPKRVEQAIEYFNQHTPVKFVPYQDQKDALVFEQGTEHCLSYLGKVGGLQPIRLSDQCQTQEILHEMMHALGFIHEHSRPDRDQYVHVLWENIDPNYAVQFAMVPDSFTEAIHGAPFDYHSVMIYRPNAFAVKDDLVTLKPAGTQPISPSNEGLSAGDLQRLNRLYSGRE